MGKLYIVLMFLILMPFCVVEAKSNNDYVVFLGDDDGVNLIYQCKNSPICNLNHQHILSTPNNTTATDKANLAYIAKHGILVVDATIGPTATIREDILIARQVKSPKLSVWFSNTERLFQILGTQEGQALLDLEVEEIKNLLDFYEVEDVEAEFYFGENGLQALMTYSKTLPITSRHQQFIKAKKLKTYIYNLTELEQKHSKPLTNNMDIVVWISGTANQAKIILDKDIETGENSKLYLQFEHPIQTKEGERFFIQINNRLVAVGIVAEILE